MIQRLEHTQEAIAKAMWEIQVPAYEVEAELIGFKGIPQLNETVEDIQQSDEQFFGYFEEGLRGFISFKREAGVIDIYRLVVNPEHFRQGIGRKLLAYLIEHYAANDFIVSTGKENVPAKKLYASFGFVEEKDFEVAPRIWCTAFRKNS
ncbi:GNAT family N-acetyltransferase [Planococcus sp. YIM B11945]|uniref:GNAT family N-acetyltransferase n=1 Tax=Planococcus sp. YIM B11945 TaxID=3435410 RepID=UPI003D7F09E1